jgi:hypothetical protein
MVIRVSSLGRSVLGVCSAILLGSGIVRAELIIDDFAVNLPAQAGGVTESAPGTTIVNNHLRRLRTGAVATTDGTGSTVNFGIGTGRNASVTYDLLAPVDLYTTSQVLRLEFTATAGIEHEIFFRVLAGAAPSSTILSSVTLAGIIGTGALQSVSVNATQFPAAHMQNLQYLQVRVRRVDSNPGFSTSFTFQSLKATVPEPATFALLGFSGVAGVLVRWRRSSRRTIRSASSGSGFEQSC